MLIQLNLTLNVHQQVLTDTWPAAESLSLELNLCVFTLH